MTGLEVRPAGHGDVDALIGLRALWRDGEVRPDYAEAFRRWYDGEAAVRWWWLAVDGQIPVGMVNVKLFDRMPSPGLPATRWGYLANLFVLPAHRGRGAGAALVGAAVDRARAEGLARLVLSPSERSVSLYLRAGFRAADELLVHPL